MRRASLLFAVALCGCDFDRDLKNFQPPDAGEDSGVDAGVDGGFDAGVDGGTDAGTDVGFDAGWVFAPDGSYNFAFITSVKVSANDLGGVAGADRLCAALAADAGLPGIYAAWVSDQGQNAFMRTGMYQARGWLRTDGKPLVDTPDELGLGALLYPMRLDERGDDVGVSQFMMAGLTSDGNPEVNCSDFTGHGSIGGGCTGCEGPEWSDNKIVPCTAPERFACFGVDQAAALQPLPVTGPLVFVSRPWHPGGGLASADAWCNAEAAALDAGEPFIALLATTTQAATARLGTDGGWMRVDGVRVGDLRSMTLDAPLVRYLNGDDTPQDTRVFTGAGDLSDAGDFQGTCGDWLVVDGGPEGISGFATFSDSSWFNADTTLCDVAASIYCVQP